MVQSIISGVLNMTDQGTQTQNANHTLPKVRVLTLDAPWLWLSRGWQDLWRTPGIGLVYGSVFSLICVLSFLGMFRIEATSLMLVLAPGFLLLGPFLATGLYQASRQLAAGQTPSSIFGLFTNIAAPGQITFFGALLTVAFLAWMRIATLLFALFVHDEYSVIADFIQFILTDPSGLALAVVGTAIGAIIAFAIFSISAISVPLMVERDVDAISAIIVSLTAVRKNPGVMALWAGLIAILVTVGLMTLSLGLIITFPLIGHATWHAYRDLTHED